MPEDLQVPSLDRVCPSCQSLLGPDDVDLCPACTSALAEIPQPTHARAPMCIICGYDSQGLPRSGKCPECGTPVEQSYLPDLLANRSPAYLRQLRSGLSWVLNGILAYFILLIGGIFVGIIAAAMAGGVAGGAVTANTVQLSLQFLGIACAMAIFFGWWRLTTPDPGKMDSQFDLKSRQVIRVTVIVQAAASLITFAVSAVAFGAPNLSMPLMMVSGAVGLASGVAWITQFFAAMLYVRWLARRVPDRKLHDKAKRFMWLGPLLYTVGIVLLGLGPLIALVMYWNMLDKLRKHIKTMLAGRDMQPATV